MTTAPITDEVLIAAKPDVIFPAFLEMQHLNRWLCNHSDLHYRAREDGYFYFGWNDNYQVVGKFKVIDSPRRVVITWQGGGEPVTEVEYTLEATDGGTRVKMTHSGYGENDAQLRENHRRGWEGLLNDLKALIETGFDARLYRRPMLGVFIDALTPERKAALGVPVDHGIVIDNVMEGMGAQRAGLQRGDVIVELNGVPMRTFDDISAAYKGKRGGDRVPVAFYRGAEKHQVEMELGKRSMPELPHTVAELAARMLETYDGLAAELDKLIKNVPEHTLAAAPQPGEWSANQNLAHLIWSERFLQMDMWNIYGGGFGIDWPDNNVLQLAGILTNHPTSDDLMAELKRAFTATIAAIKAMPPETADRKVIYMRIAETVTNYVDHTREHIGQIRSTLEQLGVKKAEAAV